MSLLPIFVVLFIVAIAVTFVIRKVIGEDHWAQLMVHRRRRMAFGIGIIMLMMTISVISR